MFGRGDFGVFGGCWASRDEGDQREQSSKVQKELHFEAGSKANGNCTIKDF